MDKHRPNAPPAPTAHAVPAGHHVGSTPLATALWLLLPLGMVVALLLLVAGGMGSLARWWLFDPAGSAWLVQRLPLVQVDGFRGALLGESWQADRIHLTWANGEKSITVQGLATSGMRWTWRPNESALVGLDIEQLSARSIAVETGKPGRRPLPLPGSIALPLQLTLKQGQVDQLRVNALGPVQNLAVQGLLLDAHEGAEHRLEGVQADAYGVHVEASARIGNRAPLPLALQATLRPAAEDKAPRWAAVLRASGNVPLIDLTGTLRGVPLPGREPPAVDLQAGLRPLLAWPLSELNLRTNDLDLSALLAQAPETRLTGSVALAARAKDAPISAMIQLENKLPGRWNERRLPLQKFSVALTGDLRQPDRLQAREITLALADATRSAGQLTGSATWQGHELKLEARLAQVSPQRLDSRAAAMQLSGAVAATLRGLPSPDRSSQTVVPPPWVSWRVDLDGKLDAAPLPVRLTLAGSANDERLEVTDLQAISGLATAKLRVLLERAGKGEWRLESAGNLVDFDPLPWWPGESGSAWRRGPHRFSADWQFDMRLPAAAATLQPVALAQRLAGSGNLRLQDSLLAGVPLSADINLGYTQAAAPTPAQLRGELLLGGNLLRIDGRGDPGGNGQADRWRAELKADTLTTLTPLTRLHPALADWVPRQGSATAIVATDGRWPNLHTEGTARVSLLQMGSLQLAQGRMDWRMETGDERPLSLMLDLAGLQLGKQRVDHLHAKVSGTQADHRIEMEGALPLLPPAVAVKLLGVLAQSGTSVQMQAQGAWQADTAGGGRWRARVEKLVVGSWDGSAGETAPASIWAQARDLRAELQFGAGGRLLALHADPGRMRLADDVALRWDEVKLDWRGAQPQIELRADIEPFALAPLLARLYPTVGWSGDIRLAAKVDIRAAERLDADMVFERRDGDLHVGGKEGMQLLGLTELRLALSAHDGMWTFSPLFKGRSLGEVTGSVRVQTTPERRWPDADAALAGEVQARVADLGIWGAWVPPGWRLGGELRTTATLGGRFAEPLYTGDVTGSGLAVRNLLQGVNLSDGQITVKLDGDRARIEGFTLRGGDGTLAVTGKATLGSEPQVQLQIKAERFRVLGRVDRMAIASGQADLALSADQIRLDGRFTMDEALYDASSRNAPSLDSDVTVRQPGEVEVEAEDKRSAGALRNFALGLELDLGRKTRVRGRGLDTGLSGRIRLSAPGGRLAVNGTISTENGTYAAYAQKLTLDRGVVAFGGPPDDPRLDILALRPDIDNRVGVLITGTALSPRVRLYSEPDMSDTEKLSWLVLGRAPEGLGRNDTALLQSAAMALLAGEGEAPTDALLKNLGIDELSLKQGEGDVRETIISLGKHLSRRWYVGYERGVNSTTGNWQLIYRIAQRFTLRAQTGLENSLDVIWAWRFQETPADAAMRKSTVSPP